LTEQVDTPQSLVDTRGRAKLRTKAINDPRQARHLVPQSAFAKLGAYTSVQIAATPRVRCRFRAPTSEWDSLAKRVPPHAMPMLAYLTMCAA